jgi:hypothetical protein
MCAFVRNHLWDLHGRLARIVVRRHNVQSCNRGQITSVTRYNETKSNILLQITQINHCTVLYTAKSMFSSGGEKIRLRECSQLYCSNIKFRWLKYQPQVNIRNEISFNWIADLKLLQFNPIVLIFQKCTHEKGTEYPN